jgi:tetratricopeptide (TPR) repeat protein
LTAGAAKLHLRADEEAVAWLGRSIESDRNWPLAHFFLGAALANLGRLEEARAAKQAGLALDPGIQNPSLPRRAATDNPSFMSTREHFYVGMRKAGVPEGQLPLAHALRLGRPSRPRRVPASPKKTK